LAIINHPLWRKKLPCWLVGADAVVGVSVAMGFKMVSLCTAIVEIVGRLRVISWQAQREERQKNFSVRYFSV
jgi:hypothetical protein